MSKLECSIRYDGNGCFRVYTRNQPTDQQRKYPGACLWDERWMARTLYGAEEWAHLNGLVPLDGFQEFVP